MELALPFGPRKLTFEAPYPPERLAIAQRRPLPESCDWQEAAAAALASPVGAEPLAEMRLGGKTVAILADPGPANAVLPTVIEHLGQAGVSDDDITIIVACGGNPTSPAEVQRQLEADIAKRCRCVCHDPFSAENRFFGFSALGTPIFVNDLVAGADFRIAIGRVRPHSSLGYSGGADAILPSACAFETLVRHGALSFASNSSCGHLGDNPSRLDAENLAVAIGLDYVVNHVVTLSGEPAAAFAGHPIKAHRSAVNFGDRSIWGAELGDLADVALASPGHAWAGDRPFDPQAIDFVAAGVRPGGSIVFLASPGEIPDPAGELERELRDASISELARMHEKRNWPGDVKEIAAKLKAVRATYIARRPFFYRSVGLVGSALQDGELERLGAEQTETMQEAIEIVTDRHGLDARVALVPDATTTLCLAEFH